MLGYGLANSYTQKFSVENIIYSFLNRCIISNLTYLLGIKIIINRNINPDVLFLSDLLKPNIESLDEYQFYVDELYNLFIEEEYYLTRGIEVDNTNLEIDYQKELYKYLMSSNIINNKDYNFDKKLKEEVILEGENNLKEIFKNVLLLYLNSSIPLTGNSPEVNNLLNNEGSSLFIRPDLEFVLPLVFTKYRKDLLLLKSSGFFNFYDKNKFLDIRNNYLEILKRQVSGLGGQRII